MSAQLSLLLRQRQLSKQQQMSVARRSALALCVGVGSLIERHDAVGTPAAGVWGLPGL